MKKTFKHTNNKQDKAEYLVSVGIILLTLVFIIITLCRQFVSDYKLTRRFIDENEFEDVQNETVYINFDKMTTSMFDYKQMHEACKQFIQTYDTVKTNIDTSVVVTESTYIDTNGNLIKDNKEDKLHETGPIYLQDKIIVRYINEKGEMRIVGCKLNNTFTTNITELNTHDVVDINNIEYIFSTNKEFNDIYDINIDKVKQSNAINKNIKSLNFSTEERRYISEIEGVLSELIINSSTDELKDKALKYFTYDGYITVLNGVNKLKDKNAIVNVVFSEAGKSSLDINYKDRLIMQLETITNDTKVVTNMIIKLNEYNKVFDIDII